MKKASTEILLVEELTDLLYELNEVYNTRCEVHLRHQREFDDRLAKIIFYTALAINHISLQTNTPRSGTHILEVIFNPTDVDDYIDITDLGYLTSQAYTHAERIRMAYANESDSYTLALLEMIELYLKDAKIYINGK